MGDVETPSTRSSRASTDCSIQCTRQLSTSDPSLYCPPNPIIMGKMHSYFRASRYKLGDALQGSRITQRGRK